MKNLFTTILFGIISFMIYGQNGPVAPGVIKTAVYFDISPALSDLPPLSAEELEFMKEKAAKKAKNKGLGDRVYPHAKEFLPTGPDEVWQKEMGKNGGSKAPVVNFAGQSSPYFPPDCNGDVGPNHFFQTVNTTYAIYSKTGTQLVAPTAMNSLFSGVTGSGNNDGDPIILYDDAADRWIAAEFSISGSNDYMLIAVSTSPDPTSTWYRWSFDVDDMPDYMKFGVQRDGYYMSTNTYNGLNNAYVFERDVMIAGGASPQMVGFPNPWRPPGFHCIQPIDCDDSFPPVGTPGQFITINDNAIGGGNDELRIFELDVNWASPASSTFNLVQSLAVTSFDSQFNSWGVGDIEQPGTSQLLDAIPMILMYRAQYRSFPSSQNIVCMHTVDVNATNHAGIRWYELQNTSGTWSIRQQGTYAPDAHSRWMGSIAINAQHAIALGYTVSSSSVYPSIRYCGQSPAENANATGILDIAEEVIQAGTNSQTSYNRWGDYSSMSVDPVNNNTFWYTSEYIGSGGSRQTKIASFELNDPPLTAEFSANTNTICSGGAVTFSDASLGSPTSWSWSFPGGAPSSSNSQNPPSISYNSSGTYNVSLTVGDGSSYDTETKTGYIIVQNVIADFTGTPTSVVVGNPVNFTDNSSCIPTSWTWSFPGGTPASYMGENPPAVYYNTEGTYNVSLTVSNAGGNDVITKTGYITVISPEFNIQNGSITTCQGNFYDTGGPSGNYSNNENLTETFYPSTPGAMVRFTFNSFSTESGYDYLYIYNGVNTSAPLIGTYNGTTSPGIVTASNASGALTFNFTSDVSVVAAGWSASISCYSSTVPPVANFFASNTIPFTGETVNFTDASSNVPTSWAWSFSPSTVTYVGGTNASSQNPQVEFDITGPYTISLTASNAYGNDVETKVGYINVAAGIPPYVDNFESFTASDYLAVESPYWTTWTNQPGGTEDAIIVSSPTHGGTKSVKINGLNDLVLPLGDKTSGKYMLSFYMYIPSGNYGYYNLLQLFNGANSVWGAEVFFSSGGSGYGNAGGSNSFTFNFSYNSWIHVQNIVDLDNDLAEISIDGNILHQWQWSIGALGTGALNQLSGLDMYAWNANGTPLYYFDDIYYRKILPIDLTAMLEGPYNTGSGLMNTDLNSNNYIPNSQPFNVSPWYYTGTESVVSIPDADIVEWALLDFRDATSAANAIGASSIGKMAAFIKNTGQVVDINNNPLIDFRVPFYNNLYVAVYQMNHLGIMSNYPLIPTGGAYTYDFSSGMDQVYGGANGHKELSPGVWGMFAGDGNRNGSVDPGDESPTWEDEAGTSGNLSSDYNLDAESNNIDKDDFWAPNLGKGSQVPN